LILFAISARERLFLFVFNALPVFDDASLASKETPMICLALFASIGTEQISQIDSLHAPVKLVGDQTLNNIILSRVIVNEEPRSRAARYLIVRSYYFHIRLPTPQQAARNALAIRFNENDTANSDSWGEYPHR
jgi:hypothetical protein